MNNAKRIRPRPTRVTLVSDDGQRRPLDGRKSKLALVAHSLADARGISFLDAVRELTAEVDRLTAELADG